MIIDKFAESTSERRIDQLRGRCLQNVKILPTLNDSQTITDRTYQKFRNKRVSKRHLF